MGTADIARSEDTHRRIVAEDTGAILQAALPWRMLEDASILVTGAGGFLASYIVETLLAMRRELGFGPKMVSGMVRNIEAANRRYADHSGRTDFRLFKADVAEYPPTITPSVDFIIHAASLATPKAYLVDPAGVLDANLQGMRAMLTLARRDNSRILFVSSGEVYGQAEIVPTAENDYGYVDIQAVRSCYAEAKRAAETMGVAWAHQFGLHVGIVRPFHTYGPGVSLNDGRVFADFVADVLADRDIVMRSDGTAVRAFCYVADATEGFFTVLLKGENATAYNIGNAAAALSISELADMLVALFPEKKLRIIRDLAPRGTEYAPSPINRNIPCIDRVRALGWAPRVMPEEGFSRMVRSYQ